MGINQLRKQTFFHQSIAQALFGSIVLNKKWLLKTLVMEVIVIFLRAFLRNNVDMLCFN